MFKTKKALFGVILCFAMMLCLSVGVMFAMPITAYADGDVKMTFSVKGWADSTASGVIDDETSGVSDTGIAAVMNNYYPKTGRFLNRATNSNSNFYIYNTDEIPGSITSITITGKIDDSNYFQNNMYAAVACESQSDVRESSYGIAGVGSEEGFSWTFTGDEGYTYFKLYSDERFSTGNIGETVITVTYTPKTTTRKLDSIYVDGTASKLKYNVGEEFDPTGLKIMGRYDDILGDTEITSGITWSFEPETLSADTTQVSVTAQFKEFTSEAKIVNGLTVTVPVHVYDILPQDFPVGVPGYMQNGWTNGNSQIFLHNITDLYLDNDVLLSKYKVLTESDGNYVYIDSVNGKYITFCMKEGVLEKINLFGFTSTQNGDYVPQPTIADILEKAESGFPTSTSLEVSPDGAWVNSTNTSATVFVYGNFFVFKDWSNPTVQTGPVTTSVVAKNGDNYQATFVNGTITFNMSDGKLVSISFEHIKDNYASLDGTYSAPAPTVTISNIIATNSDFPTSNADAPANAWVSDNGHTLYTNGICLYSDTIDNEVVGLKEIVIKNGDSYYYTHESATITFNMKNGVLISISLSNVVGDYTGSYAPASAVTVADILGTVEGGFPSSDDGNAPSNSWLNSNNEKMFSCEGDLYVGGESDGDFVLLANTELTKDGNNYKCMKDDATVTFIMSDSGALTSIRIDGLIDCDKLNGPYSAPHVHNFTYSANSNVLTATCDNLDSKCTLPECKLTLTLTAPTSLAFDNNPKAFTFADGEATAWTTAGLELPTIFYNIKQSGQSSYLPLMGTLKFVGDYMAQVTVDGKTASALFNISQAEVDKPQEDTTVFTYNGNPQTYNIAPNELYSIDGNEKTDAGNYIVTVSLRDKTNYKWKSADSEDLTFDFVIGKATGIITVNQLQVIVTYGEAVILPIATSNFGTVTCDTLATDLVDAGSYNVFYTLDGTSNYFGATKKVIVVINKAEVNKPTLDTTNFVYTGSPLTYTVAENTLYTVSGNEQTEVGEYIVTVSLNDKNNYEWNDSTTDDLQFNFIIKQAKIDKPVDEDKKEIVDPYVVIIDSEKGIDPNAVLVIKIVSTEVVEDVEKVELVLNENSAIGENEKIYGIYDAKLLIDGVEQQPDGNIKIKMLIPEELNGKQFKLYHIHNGTEVIQIENYTNTGDGYIAFETDKLSQFAFVAENPPANGLSIGAIIAIVIASVVVLGAIVFIIIIVAKKKKEKNENK